MGGENRPFLSKGGGFARNHLRSFGLALISPKVDLLELLKLEFLFGG
jgi:hypothetical protein